MQEEMTIYVRNKKGTPIGVLSFAKTDVVVGNTNDIVIALGWSKACKRDVFTKKFGRNISMKRSIKARKWVNTVFVHDDVPYTSIIDIDSNAFADNTPTLPFVIKQNLAYYLETAKDGMDVTGDAVFIIPIIETIIDVTDDLMTLVDVDIIHDNPIGLKKHTHTRYIKVFY